MKNVLVDDLWEKLFRCRKRPAQESVALQLDSLSTHNNAHAGTRASRQAVDVL